MLYFSFLNKKKRRKKKLQSFNIFFGYGIFFIILVGLGVYHYVQAFGNQYQPIEVVVDPNFGVRMKVIQFFEDNNAEEMIPIIKCESQFKQYDPDGTALKNTEGSSATGVAQILSSVHPDPKIIYRYNKRYNMDVKIDDFDINTLNGNIGYALVLYKVNGVKDWECSKKFRF